MRTLSVLEIKSVSGGKRTSKSREDCDKNYNSASDRPERLECTASVDETGSYTGS